MEIIPVINCDNFECVKDKLTKAASIISGSGEWIHIDISDGKYALEPKWNDPESLKKFLNENGLDFYFSVHFMMEQAQTEIEKWSPIIKKAVIPIDNKENPAETAFICQKLKIIPCLSVPPSIEIEEAVKYAGTFKDFQILAVSPGPSGQKMQTGTLEKISALRKKIPSAIIEIDGGVNPSTLPFLKEAGADVALSGSYIFENADPISAYEELKKLAV
ncbi:MAG: hypothetical protein PHS16_02995 [Candidatus Colwellbacteria bacterium]|jgi:ribulose-phosphate 3-epimerase|nr:hypothetical protein [Candidatus Colwellbacteria bacterium]MDD3752870.1 hypothetical protein [Candidatus Colwellbacteria bacterium]MDD4819055.1 hypothetical protein [Candidatus Colwellbacteria bacterium]